ncbi:MAG: hypothetical protein PHU25_10940 [Deltaproteobacteria bacterium]|nr:hypothetical protein [Deltaproteobacteria bacterium]
MRAAAIAVVLLTTAANVPAENTARGERPGAASAGTGARRLLDAIKADDPALAAGFFFPADAFDLVKDLPVPGRYHRKLMAWYGEDIHAAHALYRDVGSLAFDRFELGRCRWMEKGTEGNKLPYWSCSRNALFAKTGGKTRRFDVHVVINWGRDWYVTHLGPIRN